MRIVSTQEYKFNCLSEPLIWFHSHAVKILDDLPRKGRIIELIKKIVIVILAPLAYLVLGSVALLGYLSCLKGTKTGTHFKLDASNVPSTQVPTPVGR